MASPAFPSAPASTASRSSEESIRACARDRFGYDTMHPGQLEAILALLTGRDSLAVMPTGSGKSPIYQIAGTLLEGGVLVVSPLIALQRDQIESLESQEYGASAPLNSTLSEGGRRETLERFSAGEVKFLVLAPEQLANPEVLEQLQAAPLALIVVDEAHCISEWGHDFRPDYLRLGALVENLGHPPVAALTATAAPPIRAEITERLAGDARPGGSRARL